MGDIVIHRHLKYEIGEEKKEAVLLGLDDTFAQPEEEEDEERNPILTRLMMDPDPDPLDLVVPGRFTRNHISYSVVGIQANAFSNLSFLRSITLPSTIQEIGSFAFTGCPNLISIVISEKNRYYSSEGNCILDIRSRTLLVGIASTRIPQGTKVIGERAFYGQIYLYSLSLPSSVKTLSRECFCHCQGFLGFSDTPLKPDHPISFTPRRQDLYLPSQIDEIPENAFRGCLSITHLHIPKGVTCFDASAFSCCNLVSIEVEEGNPVYEVKENCLIEKEDQVLVLGCQASKIPDNVTAIGFHAFSHISFWHKPSFPASLKKIYSYAFEGCEDLTNVTLKEGMEEIYDYAFYGCKGIERLHLPEGLKSIGDYAFYECISIRKVSLPSSIESIGEYAFADTLSLTSLSLPKQPIFLGDGAFEQSGIESVVIPSTYRRIPRYCFAHCNSLREVILKEGLEEIEDGAFEDCPSLTSLFLPDSLKVISDGAFKDCDKITSLHIGKNLGRIYPEFFHDTDIQDIDIDEENPYYVLNGRTLERRKNITAKVIRDHLCYVESSDGYMHLVGKGTGDPDGEYEIIDEVEPVDDDKEDEEDDICGCEDEEEEEEEVSVDSYFSHPYSLSVPERISFHDKEFVVNQIDDGIFYQDENLESISLPSTLVYIGSDNFFFCPKLKTIHIDEKNPYYSSKGNTLINKGTKTLLIGLSDSEILEGVVSIAEKAFFRRKGLKKIIVPSSVREIGNSAFMDCTGLEEADLSQCRITTLEGVFSGCTSLRKVILPQGLKEIGPFTFSDCVSLKELSLPASIENIDFSAFNRCRILSDVTVSKDNPYYEVRNHGLIHKGEKTLLHAFVGCSIPEGIKKIGEEAFCGDETIESIEIPSSVKEISAYAFHACRHLRRVIFHEGLLQIGEEAFGECPIEELLLPEGLLSISDSAFASNPALKKIAFPSTLHSLPPFAFEDFRQLEEVYLPDTIESLGEGVFSSCRKLRKVRLPSTLTSLPDKAFYQDESLTSISLPDSIHRIGKEAFSFSGLVSVSLPKDLKSIPVSLFYGCVDLKEVILPLGLEKICAYAFACSGLERFSFPKGIHRIASSLFYGCKMLKEVSLPDDILVIGEEAFRQSSIESIVLPKGIKKIEEDAFRECFQLKSISLPEGIQEMETGVFTESGLEEISLPKDRKVVPSYLCSLCRKLKKVSLLEGITVIDQGAFSNCLSLESLVLPDSLEEIREGAFCGCSSLTSIHIGKNLTWIDEKAFEDTDHIKEVDIDPDNHDIFFDGKTLRSRKRKKEE